jgi:hypothetical protein
MPNVTEKCKACSKDFLIIEQEQRFYTKKSLPTPGNCPDCRQKRRLSLRNERQLCNRTCDKCSSKLISTYSSDSQYVVYCQECFWKHLG